MNVFVYEDRYKLPAGILAVLVNGLFFAFIIFGVSWRVVPQPPMVVDIWDSLPEMKAPVPVETPPAIPPREFPEPVNSPAQTVPVPVKTVEPSLPGKAEIEQEEKKKKKEKELENERAAQRKKKAELEAMKALKLREAALEAAKALKLQEAAQEAAKARKLQEIEQAERERLQSEKLAASNSIVNDYKAKILAKIKRKIKWPEEGHITAIYEVTLLPDGSVLESRLVKPSGNPAYDRQTESAIESAQPLPLPPADQALFRQFRKLQLKFSPTE